MSRLAPRLLIAFALLVTQMASAAEVTPLPQIVPDEVEALDAGQLRARANRGDLKAQAELGARYARGAGVTVDLPRAISLFERAAGKNDANAQYYLGTAYAAGAGVKQDVAQAARLFAKAADQGHAGGQLALAVIMTNGEGGLKADPAAAAALVLKAAEQGYIPAAYRMAQLYIAGLGVERNTEEAALWYRRILKTTDHMPSHAGLVALIDTREAKWQPGDPVLQPPPEQADSSSASAAQSAAVAPTDSLKPPRAPIVIPPEKEVTKIFEIDRGVKIDVVTKRGSLTLYSTSDRAYTCQLLVDFTFLKEDGERQKGDFVCFHAHGKPGGKVQVCDASHRNFVHTKVESVKFGECITSDAK